MASSDELIDIVNTQGKVLRQAGKHEAHRQGHLHKTIQVIVRDGDDWIFVRQTPDRQDAGQLVPPVGGHVKAGETELAAVARECLEEIGITNMQHRFVGRARFHRTVIGRDENHLMYIYEITTNDPFVLGTEADAVERFTPVELARAMHKTPERFGGAHYFACEHFFPHLLPPSHTYRWNLKRMV